MLPLTAKWKLFKGAVCNEVSQNDENNIYAVRDLAKQVLKLMDTDEVRLPRLRWKGVEERVKRE